MSTDPPSERSRILAEGAADVGAPANRLMSCVNACGLSAEPAFALAELNMQLSSWTPGELQAAIATAPSAALSPFLSNYIAAMIEQACERRSIPIPTWTQAIAPLADPVFGSKLESLRAHLLTHSPPVFRRRNIFIDSALGDSV